MFSLYLFLKFLNVTKKNILHTLIIEGSDYYVHQICDHLYSSNTAKLRKRLVDDNFITW